jgi:hypothetical protein
MPVSQGFVRLRKHQFGRQQTMGTVVPATQAYLLTGVPTVDLAWTDPEGDVGSRDPVAPPTRGAEDLTASKTIPTVQYNMLPLAMCGFFGGQEVPVGAGTAQTWTHTPASLTTDDPDLFTHEFGDDVLPDWYQFGDGIIESFEFSGEDKGALTGSMNWRFATWASTGSTDSPVVGTVPTPGLNVERDAAIIYLKDGAIYIADDPYDLFDPSTKIELALHSFVFRGDQEIDQKRLASGNQSFGIDVYGPGARNLEIEAVYAKTAQTVGLTSESDAWMSDAAVQRYIGLRFVSTVLAESPSTFYGWDVIMTARYYTREDGEIGGNTTVTLNAHANYDPDDFAGVFQSVAVTTLTEAELGLAGS